MLAKVGFELSCALPVDVEQDVATVTQRRLHRSLWGAVAISENMRPFDEVSGRDHAVEFRLVDEMVIDIVGLAGAFGPRRRRYRHRDLAVSLHQHPGAGRLPCARE